MIEQKKKNGRLIALCWLVYVSTYLTKYSYNANINRIMPFFNVNHAEAGLVSTLFFFFFTTGFIVSSLVSVVLSALRIRQYYDRKSAYERTR